MGNNSTDWSGVILKETQNLSYYSGTEMLFALPAVTGSSPHKVNSFGGFFAISLNKLSRVQLYEKHRRCYKMCFIYEQQNRDLFSPNAIVHVGLQCNVCFKTLGTTSHP